MLGMHTSVSCPKRGPYQGNRQRVVSTIQDQELIPPWWPVGETILVGVLQMKTRIQLIPQQQLMNKWCDYGYEPIPCICVRKIKLEDKVEAPVH